MIFTTGFDRSVLPHTYIMIMGGNMDWSVTTGPMFYILQFQCKDRSVTFVFPKITWTEYVTH